MGRWSVLIFLLAAMIGGARADAPALTTAHPAFWTVHGRHGTAYLLSSVHLLPPGISWHTPEIDAAAKASDTFIFEVPPTADAEDEMTHFILAHGLLPPGVTLPSLLSPAAQKAYADACLLAGMQTAQLDDKRPWLAAVVLTASYMTQRHYSSATTPDDELLALAAREQKSLAYLDTTQEQLDFLLRYDDVSGANGFSAMLGDFAKQPAKEDALVAAWSSGDVAAMERQIAANFADDAEGRRAIDARNRAWADHLERLLNKGRTYFVTVGVAHLVGPNGLPTLLRADGYTVDGP